MNMRVQVLDRRLLMRQCVACGYDGALLRGGAAPRCARCGCDLHKRPARSYAEMEGLLGQPVFIERACLPGREQALLQKWLLVFFIMTIAMIAFFYLVASAFPA